MRVIKLIIGVILIAILAIGGPRYFSTHNIADLFHIYNKEKKPANVSKELYGPYSVEYVIDGDTVILNIDDEATKVRFIGVDTPESVAEDEYLESSGKQNTEEGKIASEYTKSLLTGASVYLEYDLQKTDDYGRTLAYVYLDPEGEDMVQVRLLRDGMANTLTVGINQKFRNYFNDIKIEAKSNNTGFWANDIWE